LMTLPVAAEAAAHIKQRARIKMGRRIEKGISRFGKYFNHFQNMKRET